MPVGVERGITVLILNRQSKVALKLAPVRRFLVRLCDELEVKPGSLNVCLLDDREIRRLNSQFRSHDRPTDVLSFPWQPGDGKPGSARPAAPKASREFRGFLGDIAISVERARRQARAEGHTTETEVCWLILHGLLHLLGYDHEIDQGQMVARELELRARLGI